MKKSVYVFSTDIAGGSVLHANYVSDSMRAKGLDARSWASKVTSVIGVKVDVFHDLWLPCL